MPHSKINQPINKQSIYNSEVAWTEGNLYYQFMHQLDMDYLEAVYMNDWDRMYKIFSIKFTKSKVYIEKYKEDDAQWNLLVDETLIKKALRQFNPNESDYSNNYNSEFIKQILEIIKKKMEILEELRAKAGMNLLLNRIREDKPAALGNDDF